MTGVASFVYDGLGRRVSPTRAGVATAFLYDGWEVAQEQQGGAASANLLGGLGVDERLTRNGSTYLTDALGSTVALASSGAVTTNYGYDAYGVSQVTGTASDNSFQYTELAAIVIAMWAAAVETDVFLLWADCMLAWVLLALAIIDLRHMRLPDRLTLPLLAAGLATNIVLAPERLAASAVGAAVGYAGFRGIAFAYRSLRGREGLGAGDAKLLAAAGAWVGWAALLDVVVLASLFGICTVTVLRSSGHNINGTTTIPFGPFLALAIWVVRLHGPLLYGQRFEGAPVQGLTTAYADLLGAISLVFTVVPLHQITSDDCSIGSLVFVV